MKKVLIMITAFVIAFGIRASAEELCENGNLFDYTVVETAQDEMELFGLSSSEKQARDEIVRGMQTYMEEINISFARVSKDRIGYIVSAAYMEHPELYYVHDGYQYWYTTTSTPYITKVKFTYMYPQSQLKELNKVIENEKEHVLSMIDSSMTDLEKIMLIHNYVVTNHTYDYSYSIYNIYDFFTKRTGVCQAYALAMTYLLRAADVECSYARSGDMNHVWNMVKIDSSWYHVDATWDDPNDDVGYCSYRYFLKSDSKFESDLGHYGWDSEYNATSAWFDNYYFTDYTSPFLYQGGEWYVQKNGKLYKINHLKYGGSEVVFAPDAQRYSGWYPQYDMSFAPYAGSFIYNVQNEIYVVNLNDYAKPRKIATVEDESYEVYSLSVNEHTLYYQTGYYAADEMQSLQLDSLVSLSYFKINNVYADEEWVHLDYTYDNRYDKNWCIYVAAYDKDNTLIAIKAVDRGKYTIAMPKADRYEAFIWEGCAPLCDSVNTK
ncbi:MAG: hypothetical protein IJ316_02755 [Clostridia bacterium]|nr:hypothetical protein [Clostridia bacterium]